MKSNFRFLGSLFLIATYCFALIVFSKYEQTIEVEQLNSSKKEQKFTNFSNSQFLHDAHSSFVVHGLIACKSLDSFGGNFDFSILKIVTQQLIKSQFYQIENSSISFLIQNKKATFLYPFHFFW